MLTARQFNLFWIALCLAVVLPGQTRTLLAVHLSACCDHHDSPSDHSQAPAHDHKHCPVCQLLLAADGKTIIAEPTLCALPELSLLPSPAAVQSHIPKSTLSCRLCRGPPCA